jgi:hypothetical protein
VRVDNERFADFREARAGLEAGHQNWNVDRHPGTAPESGWGIRILHSYLAFVRRIMRTHRSRAALPARITLPLTARDAFVSGVLPAAAERPTRSRTLVTTATKSELA